MNILNLIGGKWIDKITFPEAFGLSDRESMPDFNLLTQFDPKSRLMRPRFN